MAALVWLVPVQSPTARQTSPESDHVEGRDEFDSYDDDSGYEESLDQDEEASIRLWSSRVAYGDHPFPVVYGD